MDKRAQGLVMAALIALGAIGLVVALTQCGGQPVPTTGVVTTGPATAAPGTQPADAGEPSGTSTTEPSAAAGGTATKDGIGQQEKQVIIVSLRKEDYEQVADISTVNTFRYGSPNLWLVLTPSNFEKLQATGVTFDRWPRVLVSLSKKAYEQVAHIPAVYTVDHGSSVWLELTPSNFARLYTTGVDFKLDVRGILLRLNGHTFDPVTEGEPSVPSELTADYTAGVSSFYIVQFFSTSKNAWIENLKAEGVKILQTLHGHARLVRMMPEQAARVERFDFVRWVGPYHPAYRVSISTLLEYSEAGVIENVAVRIYDDDQTGGTVDRTVEMIEAMNGTLVDRQKVSTVIVKAEFVLPTPALTSTAQLNNVFSLSYESPVMIVDGEMSDQIAAGQYNPLSPSYYAWLQSMGVSGGGVRVALIDTGYDT